MTVPVSPCHVDHLVATALQALPGMLDPRAGVFVFSRRPSGNAGLSLRYSCIALIGLLEARRAGLPVNCPIEPILHGIAERHREIRNWGELGLLLWALSAGEGCATSVQEEIADAVSTELEVLASLNTSELAWLLTGLCRSAAVAGTPGRWRARADAVYGVLRRNVWPSSGLFCFGGRASGPRGWLRRRLGFFDNQAYGMYAAATYAQTFGCGEALALAGHCAERLTPLQARHGQWPWYYNARTGRVVDRYPVYSVHQHGMAPMALTLVGAATGRSYETAIARGLAWSFGDNELQTGVVEASVPIVWRSIRRVAPYRRMIQVFRVLSLLRLERANAALSALVDHTARLEIDRECRPYELGWLLHALVGRSAHGAAAKAEMR